VALQEVESRGVEGVVAVAGHHVAGSSNIDGAGVRNEFHEILGMFLLDQFRGRPAHQQRRDGDPSGGLDKAIKLWEVATGKLLRTFPLKNTILSSVAFSPGSGTARPLLITSSPRSPFSSSGYV